jgi:Domain of unknown function (DUF4412)
MITGLLAALFFLGSLSLGRADLVITQRVEGSMQSGTITIKIKGDKSRADIAPQLSTITDGATGDVVTLMHPQKTFMKIPADRSRALLEQMQKQQAAVQPNAAPPKLTPAGKKEKVENYDCELFKWDASGLSATYWIAKDYPKFADILAAMDKIQNSGLAVLARSMTPKPGDFPGMPVKTELTIAGQKVTTTLVSVTDENLDAALFAVPGDYKEAPTPAFDFPAGK